MPTSEGARSGSLISLFQIALLFSACFTIASCATSNGANGQGATQNVNAVPVLSSLSATSVIAGTQGLTITVNGNGFVQGSIVEFNGSTRTTSYVSATQLQATLTSADIAVGGP